FNEIAVTALMDVAITALMGVAITAYCNRHCYYSFTVMGIA
ncbi:7456_t:CDS:1, partial [Racocetra persica]